VRGSRAIRCATVPFVSDQPGRTYRYAVRVWDVARSEDREHLWVGDAESPDAAIHTAVGAWRAEYGDARVKLAIGFPPSRTRCDRCEGHGRIRTPEAGHLLHEFIDSESGFPQCEDCDGTGVRRGS
jgi:hypothetical protein